MAGVELNAVVKRYGAVTAVERLDLDIPDGTFATFLGPSGCGKTTTLRMVAGLERPSAGTIRIGGRVVSGDGVYVQAERREIGMVFQSYAIWPHLSIFENVCFPLRVRRLARAEIRDRTERALGIVRLSHLADRYPGQLSGGQQQRVALARALVFEPKLLLLDEPLSNLDARLRQEMRIEIHALQRRFGVTTLYVTHDQEEALALSDRIYVMDQGRLQQAGTPIEINETPANRFVADFVGWTNFVPARVSGPNEVAALGTVLRCAVPARIAAGADVLVAIRPRDIDLAERASLRPHNVLRARIDVSVYMSAYHELRARAGEHVLVVHAPAPPGAGPGGEIVLHLPPERIRVLPP